MPDSDPEPHDYVCDCKQCRMLAATIIAKTSDGEYLFTDEELLAMLTTVNR